MQKIYVYQIVDDTSEGILHTFMAPNDVLAIRMFSRFINDPKFKGRIVPSDFRLVRSPGSLETYEAYSEVPNEDTAVEYGEEVVEVSEDES